MNIDVTEIIALFAQLAGPAFSVAFVFGFGAKLVHSFLSMGLDGAKEGRIFLQIVMPNVKPAWLTVTIFSVQNLWNMKGQVYIYSEEYKMLPYALQQIMAGGVARAGVGSAATMVVMMVPILIFVLAESNILETMASSGIKD